MTGDTVNKYVEILENQARPLIQIGVYKDEAAFLRDLVRDMAQRKIEVYQDKIRRYEQKHQSLEKFRAKLGYRPFPEQEDEAWDWDAAIDLLDAWQRVAEVLKPSAT
jgi:hypothetical protein